MHILGGRARRVASVTALLVFALLLVLPHVGAGAAILVRIEHVAWDTFPEISVDLTARDGNGLPLRDLAIEHVEIIEDGAPRAGAVLSVEPFVNPDVPVSVVLAIDVSGSMRGKPLADAKNAALLFLNTLSAQDRVALLAFSRQLDVDAPLPITTDKREVAAAVDALVAGGGTPLYDAAYKAVVTAATEPEGVRAVLLLTDGHDEGSALTSVEDAIQEANRSNIPVFTIGLGQQIDRQWLQRVAMRTGATYQETPDSGELDKLFRNVSDLLKQQYRVTFRTGVAEDGAMHRLNVIVRQGALAADATTHWGPVPLAATPPPTDTVVPTETPVPSVTATAPLPTEVPPSPTARAQAVVEESVNSSTPWSLIVGVLALVAIPVLAVGALSSRARRRNADTDQPVCPECGRPVGADGLCPDCKKPGVRGPTRS